jgi:hypothetical protein
MRVLLRRVLLRRVLVIGLLLGRVRALDRGRVGLLSIRRLRVLRRHLRLVDGRHGSRGLELALELVVVGASGVGASSSQHLEVALLAGLEKHDVGPDARGDEQEPEGCQSRSLREYKCCLPDKGTNASRGRELVKLGPVQDRSLPDAKGAEAAARHAHVYECGARGGRRGKGGQPEDHQETLEDQHGDDVVCNLQSGDDFGEDNVGKGEPGDDGLRASVKSVVE